VGGERADTHNEVVWRFLWACFILAQVYREYPAITQGGRVFLDSGEEGGESRT
jgi:hypothetical protein